MSRHSAEFGIAFWLRFGEWCRARPWLLTVAPKDAAQAICDRFGVSRATGFRWLTAWREVAPASAENAWRTPVRKVS